MPTEIKPIRTDADHQAALAEVERLWDAREGTPESNRLDALAAVIVAYEERHFPFDPPDPGNA